MNFQQNIKYLNIYNYERVVCNSQYNNVIHSPEYLPIISISYFTNIIIFVVYSVTNIVN